ncbi:MAG: TIGR03915 family putative DNA repair protein [Bacteroidales bacterium]
MRQSPVIYTYDGTREGFFSVVFRAFEDRCSPSAIISRKNNQQMSLGEVVHVKTNREKASRVAKGINERVTERNARLVHLAFLVDEPEIPMLLWRYLYKLFTDTSGTFHCNMLDEDVYAVTQQARRVRKEVHRFHGLVRFRETTGRLLVANIEPDHDIVMMLAPHFRTRMAEQQWVIYDMRRARGVWYDTRVTRMVRFNPEDYEQRIGSGLSGGNAKCADSGGVDPGDIKCGECGGGDSGDTTCADSGEMGYGNADAGDMKCVASGEVNGEDPYRELWQHYYDAINIRERKNHRQMRSCMPQRYWKYLPEKGRK